MRKRGLTPWAGPVTGAMCDHGRQQLELARRTLMDQAVNRRAAHPDLQVKTESEKQLLAAYRGRNPRPDQMTSNAVVKR